MGCLPVIRRVWARKGVRVHAPCKTTCQWGYLHEALEVYGEHKVELLFTPTINQDAYAVFLKQIAESDPEALHVVIMEQRISSIVRVVSLPPYSPSSRFAGVVWSGGKSPNSEPHLSKSPAPGRPHHRRSAALERSGQGGLFDSRMDVGRSKRYRQNKTSTC